MKGLAIVAHHAIVGWKGVVVFWAMSTDAIELRFRRDVLERFTGALSAVVVGFLSGGQTVLLQPVVAEIVPAEAFVRKPHLVTRVAFFFAVDSPGRLGEVNHFAGRAFPRTDKTLWCRRAVTTTICISTIG